LITGAALGIGRPTAILFVAEGANVAVNDASEKSGQKQPVIRKSERHAIFLKTDVTNARQIKTIVDHIVKQYGRIDILQNIARPTDVKPLANSNDAS
jgi:glucose 1-dehydrogenase